MSLPEHGRVLCNECFDVETQFDVTKKNDGGWRITNNPLSWGTSTPEVVVLGFSKGPTQAGALSNAPHDSIAYKGSRLKVGKVLSYVGLLDGGSDEELRIQVDEAISNPNGRFHFASLIRCTVERYNASDDRWKGSGGGMLDKFIATEFGNTVVSNCTQKFLSQLPPSVKLVIMFGLGTKQNYVEQCYKLFRGIRSTQWNWLNKVAYTDGEITVVHVEHFASQGALIPNWLGKNQHPRSELGVMAREAVHKGLGN